ncbi:MAG: hemolysin family protein [Deltaproteobacteria bacterium]|nr:hemolysin family protein [Deltaproteobacteria bacterium]
MHGQQTADAGSARGRHILLELAIIALLILANGIFSGAEIAIVALRKSRIHELIDARRSGARAIMALRNQPERFLATVQIGITVIGASAAAFGGATLADRLTPVLARIGLAPENAEDVALAVVVAGVSYLSIVVGELVPKSLALRYSEGYALLIARPLLALSWAARPLVWLLTASSNTVLRPFHDHTTFTETRHSAEEVQHLVEEAAKAGTVHPDAGEIASRAIDFADLTAADVMLPRQEVVMLPRRATTEEVQRILLEHAHSRIPVYADRVDNVVGYINVKDVLALAWQRDLSVLDDLLRPPFFVPDSKPAIDLMREMRARRVIIAFVVDEQGGMEGIVTMEDLVEELVGEIFSEYEQHVPEAIHREPGGTVLVAGATPIRDVNRALDLTLPEDDEWNTIAGICLALAGRIPAVGDRIAIPDNAELEIVEATPRRVRTVRIHPQKVEATSDES